MIKINFQEPVTSEWRAWLDECRTEQERHNDAIEAGQSSDVKKDVYKGKRYNIKDNIYMSLDSDFHGKCAYCESSIANNQPGDIEHFRPRGKVTDVENKPIMVDKGNGMEPHPGYYWLAYDWKNLLLSCRDCNRIAKSKSAGKLIGKGNRFPVKDFRAVQPDEEIREEPLLIHPVLEDPEEHLEVDETGIMKAKNGSEKGKTCIDIFGLNNREALQVARKDCFDDVKARTCILAIELIQSNTNDISYVKEILQGRKAYSAAARTALKQCFSKLTPLLDARKQLNG